MVSIHPKIMAKAMPPMPKNGANLGVYSDDDPTRSAMVVKVLDGGSSRVLSSSA